MYPRKERKNDALKAYKKAIKKGIDPLIIKKGIVEYKNYLEVNKTLRKAEHGLTKNVGTTITAI